MSAVRNKEIKSQKLEAFTMNNTYFIYIPKMEKKLSIIISEYGENNTQISYEKLKEYGRPLGNIYLQ
jgi:negative regulator of genetic competence, sporulation and motility